MKTWLANRWDGLRTNFWFIPSLMVAASVILANLALKVDENMGKDNWFLKFQVTVNRGPEGSRALLSMLAGSMITIASLTFSITIVSLQLASTQFGPRLIRNFMRDRGNQFTLGAFISTFVFSLLVLRTVNGTEDNSFVPHLSVSAAVLMALLSIGVLIYFINHTAHSIQVDRVINAVVTEFHDALDGIFPELEKGEYGRARGFISGTLPTGFDAKSLPIEAEESGYVQGINQSKLLDIATAKDLVIRADTRPGRFVIRGIPVGYAWPSDRVDESTRDEIREAFYIGDRRTITQDVEFAIDQIVEIAIRALSPGINDTFTALSCVDRLGECLVAIDSRRFPPRHHYDEKGVLRLETNPSTQDGVVDAAFHQIRQSSTSNVAVACRLLEVIGRIGDRSDDSLFRDSLRRHARLILESTESEVPSEPDRGEIRERFDAAIEALQSADPA